MQSLTIARVIREDGLCIMCIINTHYNGGNPRITKTAMRRIQKWISPQDNAF